jgi:thioesterase-3
VPSTLPDGKEEQPMKNKEIKIRGFHLDQFGHVNNIRYPEMLEEARYDFFDQFPGFFTRVQKIGYYLPITEIHIYYRKAAFLDDILDIRTRISSLGKTSGTIHQTVSLKGTDRIILEAEVTFVAVNIKTGKRAPIEGNLSAEIASVMSGCNE